MKTTIKHVCGHVSTVQLYGSARERAGKEKWLSGQPCLECKRNGQLAAAQETTREYALPPLEGSEKQRAWATSIRAEWLKRMHEAAARYGDKAEMVREALIEVVSTKRSAAYWIDNRSNISAALAADYEAALRRRGVTE
jgi:hypothetical protein